MAAVSDVCINKPTPYTDRAGWYGWTTRGGRSALTMPSATIR
ncbi:MAG: hypothetical protein QXR26_07480 [Candidatus Caldarchaeum sp.]